MAYFNFTVDDIAPSQLRVKITPAELTVALEEEKSAAIRPRLIFAGSGGAYGRKLEL